MVFVTYSQQSENKRSIAFLSCPICPKIRCGSLRDLAKKRHLLDPVGANAHMAQREDQPARCKQKKKRVTVTLHVLHLHATGSICDHAARAVPMNSQSNPSRKAHSPVISSFESLMYFFTLMPENTWIVIHDHTTIIEAIYATELRPPTSTRAMYLGHPHRQEHYRQIKWLMQVAKPIYRTYPVSNLQCAFLHSCPSTRES